MASAKAERQELEDQIKMLQEEIEQKNEAIDDVQHKIVETR